MRTATAVLALLVALMAPPIVDAHLVGNRPWTPSTFSGGRFQSSWRTANDSQSFYLNVQWNAEHRTALASRYSLGERYTQEFLDSPRSTPLNLHATSRFATTFNNPSYDTDDDNGDYKDEEAEITANSTAFPQVGENYYAQAQFSHWYLQCGLPGCGNWLWDPDSGEIGNLSQLSVFQVIEWNAVDSSQVYKYVPYPYQAPPPGATPGSAVTPAAISASIQGPGASFVFDTLTLSAVPDGSQIDVRVLAPRDLSAYAEQNRRRAASLLFGQDAEVVVTFVRPLSPEEFARLATLEQFTVRSIEAIGRERDGTILTIGGEPAMTAVLQEEYANRQASLEGIVAAYGTTNKAGFDVLSARSDVALVDVSPAFLRANLAPALPANLAPYSDRLDVLVNDVYWLLAGLE